MNRFLITALLILIVTVSARATTDPLNSSFKPAMDTNCAHSQYASNIWMTDSLTKLRQDSGSPASNACTLTVYGSQNEFVDFQVHVQAPGGGYSSLTVSISDLVQTSPNIFTISAATSVPPKVIVYREAYIHIQGYPTNHQTDANTPGGANFNTYYGGALGFYPDILIPTVDPYWGQTTNAQPFSVTAGNNQSFWVDALIPSNAPSGYYSATVTVKNGVTTLATMPVTIAVWQWPNASYMPATPTLAGSVENFTYNPGQCQAMYNPGSTTADCSPYPGSGGANDGAITMIWLDGALLTKDHRFPMAGSNNIFPQSGSFSTWATYVGPLMTGGNITHNGAGTTHPLLPGSTMTAVKSLALVPMNITTGSESGNVVTLTVDSLSTDCVVGGFMTVKGATPDPNSGTEQYFYNNAYTLSTVNYSTNTITATAPVTGLTSITAGQATCPKASFQNWQTYFDAQGYGIAGHLPLFYGLWDEPTDFGQGLENYTSIYNQAVGYHAMLSTGVPLFVTNNIFLQQNTQAEANSLSTSVCGNNTCLINSMDIIVPIISSFEFPPALVAEGAVNQTVAEYQNWLAQTPNNNIPRQVWSYQTCSSTGTCGNTCPGPDGLYGACGGSLSFGQVATWPNYSIDGKPAANRAMEWLTFLHGFTGEIYYSPEVCEGLGPEITNICNPSVAGGWDPWNGVYYSGNWGDGTLIYSGGVLSGKVNYMGVGVTTPIILPSIRLKHIRDGVQDYEYLNALTVAGKGSVVSTQIASWITNSYTFETSGAGLQAARLNLGTTMHQLSFPPSPPTGLIAVPGVTLPNGSKIQ